MSDDEENNITLDLLKSKRAMQVNIEDQVIREWSIYKCLYAEIDLNDEKYLLVSGKYYRVDKGYKTKVENDFTVDTSFALPDWQKSKHENVYNMEVATIDANFQCLDGGANQRNLIGKGKIEFADLVKTDKHLIHVKKYGLSAVLSHLFSQGLVSATLLRTERSFRIEVNNKLAASHKNVVTIADPNPAEYTVVYAIGTPKDDLRLPFFSLVNYKNIKTQLGLYGYNVLMVKINQIP